MVGNISLLDHPQFNYHNKGFCAIVSNIIDIALEHFNRFNDYNVSISDGQTEKLFTCNKSTEGTTYDASNYFLTQFFNKNTQHNIYNAHKKANVSNLQKKNLVMLNTLKLKSDVEEEFKGIKNSLLGDKKTLGIHLRGTDKITELPSIPEDTIYKCIDTHMNMSKCSQIFLSTDDIFYVNLLQNKYGKEVVKYNSNNTISYNKQPLHKSGDRHKINKEVLSDVYLLSTVDTFLYCFSNVSLLSLIIGINKFSKICNINTFKE